MSVKAGETLQPTIKHRTIRRKLEKLPLLGNQTFQKQAGLTHPSAFFSPSDHLTLQSMQNRVGRKQADTPMKIRYIYAQYGSITADKYKKKAMLSDKYPGTFFILGLEGKKVVFKEEGLTFSFSRALCDFYTRRDTILNALKETFESQRYLLEQNHAG